MILNSESLICSQALAEEGITAVTGTGKKADLLYFDLNGMKNDDANISFAEGNIFMKPLAMVLEEAFGSENCCHINADRFFVFAGDRG